MFGFVEDLIDIGLGHANPNNNTRRVSHSYTQRTNQSHDDNEVVELLKDVAELVVSIKTGL